MRPGKLPQRDLSLEASLNGKEIETVVLMEGGLGMKEQREVCVNWLGEDKWCSAAKYKLVDTKFRPVNVPMQQYLNPQFQRLPLSRDPFLTPLRTTPPEFRSKGEVTEEQLKMIDFGPTGWCSEEEIKLLKHVIVL